MLLKTGRDRLKVNLNKKKAVQTELLISNSINQSAKISTRAALFGLKRANVCEILGG